MRKIPQIVRMLVDHGSYCKPVVRFLIKEKIYPLEWQLFFKCLDCLWSSNYIKCIFYADKGISRFSIPYANNKKYNSNTNLMYIFKSIKLLAMRKANINDWETLLDELKSSYNKMPSFARRIIINGIRNLCTRDNVYYSLREWKKPKIEDEFSIIGIMANARILADKKDYPGAIALFEKVLKLSLKKVVPIYSVLSSNDLAWYLFVSKQYEKAYEAINKSLYIMGYYYEEFNSKFSNSLETAMDIFSVYNQIDFLFLVRSIKGLLNNTKYNTNNAKYIKLNKIFQKYALVFTCKSYENTLELRDYIKTRKKATLSKASLSQWGIFKLMNSKTDRIKASTISTIIKDFSIPAETNAPIPILAEQIKIDINNNFEKALSFLNSLNEEDRLIQVFSTYSSFIQRNNIIKSVCRQNFLREFVREIHNVEKIRQMADNNFELKIFINCIYRCNTQYESGRKDLIIRFMKNLKDKKDFVYKYLELNENEKLRVEKFLRNYVRYDFDWSLNIEDVQSVGIEEQREELKHLIIKKYDLNAQTFLIVIHMEKDERVVKTLLKVLNKLI